MRIDPQSPATTGNSGVVNIENTQSAQLKNSQRAAVSEPSDTVQLSAGSATVRQLVTQLDQVPDIRREQVSALRSALDSGQYNPGNAQVAEALAAQTFGISEQA